MVCAFVVELCLRALIRGSWCRFGAIRIQATSALHRNCDQNILTGTCSIEQVMSFV